MLCPSLWGFECECTDKGCEVCPLKLNILVPNCQQSALLLCGSFSANLKQAVRLLHELSGRWDLEGSDDAQCRDLILGGPVPPKCHKNYRVKKNTAAQTHLTEIRLALGETKTQIQTHPTDIKELPANKGPTVTSTHGLCICLQKFYT